VTPDTTSLITSTPRGKLRIFFGAASCVGKTTAMLEAARKLKGEGKDVVIGLVETHNCAKTDALCQDFESLPLTSSEYFGRTQTGFDLHAALQRRPALLLLDDLAQSNLPGARHARRWQDVEELLDTGIDLYATMDVQQLESLGNVVHDIVGHRVADSVPDTLFDEADEIILVDLPVEELLKRLEESTRNQHPQLCKGDLIALRELALRRTADRVEDDAQAYRIENSVQPIWKTDATLLACIGHQSDMEYIVRSGARLSNQLNTAWHVVYVETPKLARLSAAQRERILNNLKLAEELGATTAVISGNDIPHGIADYARSHNISKVLLGRSRSFWKKLFGLSFIESIAQYLPNIDIIETGRDRVEEPSHADSTKHPAQPEHHENALEQAPPYRNYAIAAGASLLTAAVSIPLLHFFDLANIVMLFLLTVVLVSVSLGRGASVVATLVGIVALVLMAPRFSFASNDLEYIVTLFVMLAVGLITGKLTADLRLQARVSAQKEARAVALFQCAKALSGTLKTQEINDTIVEFIHQTFHCKATLLLPDAAGKLQITPNLNKEMEQAPHLNFMESHIAQWVFDHGKPAGHGTDTLARNPFFYLPLLAPMHAQGVLAIQPSSTGWILTPEQRRQLDTFAALAAIALERVHYVDIAQEALLKIESEKLRNSLLSALSHDLRTPLTSLAGLSEALCMSKPPLSTQQLELADSLRNEALRMNNLVSNLLEMARIQSGNIRLHLQWQAMDEVVGTAIRICRPQLSAHTIQARIAPDLPLVKFDAVLIERVLCNLLENAAKYTPVHALIAITAVVQETHLAVTVSDNGPGLPKGMEETLFEKFVRGNAESAIPGIGLGLSICRAIIEAHGGTIHAAASPERGAAFIFTLPLGTPPDISSLDENEINITHVTS
jgi:two-component system sensor histidine kinase KdpD